jgi:hypothetical protein
MAKSKKIATDSVFNSGLGVIAMPDEEYQKLVAEGKEITAAVSGKQWALGDLADKVVTKIGREDKLVQFAKDINFSGNWCTLERYRTVCRAFPKNRGRPLFFGTAQVLAKLPEQERFAHVERNPNISVREAQEIMKKWRGAEAKDDDLPDEDQPEKEDPIEPEDAGPTPTSAKAAMAKGPKRTADEVQEDVWLSDTKKWFHQVIVHANAATELNEVMKCTPEQRRQLALTIEPELAEQIFENAAKAYLTFIAWFKEALAEASREVTQKGLVKTSPSPKRRKEPAQPEA